MRYAIISDIHSNLAAFEAVLADLDIATIDELWCLGDVVGYGPDPNECIARLQELPHRCIAGNHDWAVLGELDIADFNSDAQRACLWTREQLTDASWEYLKDLEEKIVEGDFTLVHGSPRHPIWEYLLSTSSAESSFAYFDTPFCFVGHTHVPVIFEYKGVQSLRAEAPQAEGSGRVCKPIVPPLDNPLSLGQDRLIINPGGVGQPRDGDPRASYAVLDSEERTVKYHRVPYPIAETQERMIKAGLPIRLIARLSYGW